MQAALERSEFTQFGSSWGKCVNPNVDLPTMLILMSSGRHLARKVTTIDVRNQQGYANGYRTTRRVSVLTQYGSFRDR
jgi:hypothetical protein